MRARILTVAVFAALVAASLAAQPKSGITHTPSACLRAGELPLLQVAVTGKGDLRGYFRRTNVTDWCSVDGTNEGPLSRIVLPKFENGDEIEYFFVLVDGARMVARSPRIYRARITAECDVAWARHIVRLAMNCGDDVQNIANALGAGYTVGSDLIEGQPPYSSPDRPNQNSNRQ